MIDFPRRVRPSRAVPKGVRHRRTLASIAITVCVVLASPVGVWRGFAPSPALAAEAAAPSDADYAERVGTALDVVEEAADGSAPDGPGAARVAARVRELLPLTEPVRSGGAVVVVDNSVLDSMLSRLEAAPDARGRSDVLEDIAAHLASVARAQGVAGAAVPEDATALARILDETRTGERSSVEQFFGDLVDRLGEALLDWWTSVGGSPEAGRTLSTVTLVVLSALAALLIWIALRAYMRARAATAGRPRTATVAGGTPAVAAAEGLPADALAHAEALASAGDRTAAVRALFGGAARLLAEAGLVRQTRTLTNAELVGEVAGRSDALARPVASLRTAFEVAWFGHRVPDAAGFEEAREAYVTVREHLARPAEFGGGTGVSVASAADAPPTAAGTDGGPA